ncbi:MAG TPA: hypothetical protein VF144_08645 [Chitinophagaceae bacterium]
MKKPFANADGFLLLHFRGVFKDRIPGYSHNSGYVYWYGHPDDLRIYDRVLIIVEIISYHHSDLYSSIY